MIGFLADSVLKFSTEIEIFIKHYKNWIFPQFLIGSPVQCCPKKANSMNIFVDGF